MEYDYLFTAYREIELCGRYITNTRIEPVIKSLKKDFEVHVAGTSVMGKPIYCIKAGKGDVRIFIWSQMHGNESTTTKAVIDFLRFLQSDHPFALQLKNNFTFLVLPIVNPDGAEAYTRENANDVDLNRDAVNLSQPESRVLRTSFEKFKPHYCYNMHDQRTIFGVGDSSLPATMSFLAPSYNSERELNAPRLKAINVIAAMNKVLQEYIPGQVGRFDDGFNINCIGDTFQSLGVPTILFEAGHYEKDYIREKTRKFVFIALLSGFNAIYENVIVVNEKEEYFNIPQNKINFYDIIYRNVKINYENKQKITNFATQYKEVLFENSVIFQAFISDIGNLDTYYSHAEFDCRKEQYHGEAGNLMPKIGEKANFTIGIDRKFVNGTEK